MQYHNLLLSELQEFAAILTDTPKLNIFVL